MIEITKEEIIKTLKSCVQVGQINDGIIMSRIFEKEADAILELINRKEQRPGIEPIFHETEY